jgi:hypothetical protein
MLTPPERSFFGLADASAVGVAEESGEGDAVGEAEAVGDSSGDGVGLADGKGDGVGLGERFPFFRGEAEGDGDAVADAEGVGEGDAERFGDGLRELGAFGVGDALGLGEGVALGFGDGEGVVFLRVLLELLRFFGGGVGLKIRFISWPNDCACTSRNSSGGAPSNAQSPTANATARAPRVTSRVPSGSLCSGGFQLRSSRAGSSR